MSVTHGVKCETQRHKYKYIYIYIHTYTYIYPETVDSGPIDSDGNQYMVYCNCSNQASPFLAAATVKFPKEIEEEHTLHETNSKFALETRPFCWPQK